MPMGGLVSFMLPNLFFDANTEMKTSEFNLYLMVQTILICCLSMPSIFLLREEPPSPPTVLLRDKDTIVQMTMGQAISALFKNKNYICMFLSFNFLYGLYCAISGVISSFTDPYGYTPGNISIICISFSIAGIFNSFFIGTLLDKYQCYKKTLVFLSFASILTLSLSFWSLPKSKTPSLAGGVMIFTGATLIPIVTVCFSFAAELSYPVPESYSIGIMISCGQIFGFVLVSITLNYYLYRVSDSPQYARQQRIHCTESLFG